MDTKALTEQRNACHAANEAIFAAAEAKGGGLTPDDLATIATNDGKFNSLTTEIQAREAHIARSVSLSADRGRRTQPDQPGVRSVEKITEARDRVLDDPKRGFKSPRDFMLAVMQVGMGRAEDPRLAPIRVTAGSDEQGGYADVYGGFLVPSGFSPTPLQLTPEGDVLAGRTKNIPMATPKVAFNARVDKTHSTSVSGGLIVYRREETAAVTASRMSFEQVELNAHSLMGVAYASEEILTDSPVSFAALLAAGFNDEIGAKLMDERINGTGIGEYLGVLNCGSLVSITKETGQAADTIVYENIIKMRSRCWRYGQAIWLYNHDTLPQLMQMSVSVGAAGSPVWQTSAREDHPDTILGRPAIATEFVSTLGDKGDIILGNWGEYVEGTYQPLRSDESIHVRFLNNERAFRVTMRNDGCPWWRAVLTPKKSTVTLSPFVTLNERA